VVSAAPLYIDWLPNEIRYMRRQRRRAQSHRYNTSEKGRARNARCEATPRARARKRAYDTSAAGRERARRYRDHVNPMWSFDGGVGHRNRRLTPEEAAERSRRAARDIDHEAMEFFLRTRLTLFEQRS
jgi:hypothetical protein